MSNDIKALFSCPICLEILFNPITTICGHNFCRDCINTSLLSIKNCPCCRVDIGNIQNYEVNKQLKDIIEMYNNSKKVKEATNVKNKVFYEKIKGYCQNSSFKLKKRSINELDQVKTQVMIINNKASILSNDFNYNNQDFSNSNSVNVALGEFEMFLSKFK